MTKFIFPGAAMEWMDLIFGSLWTYIALAGFFVLIMVVTIIHWLKKKPAQAENGTKTNALESMPSEIDPLSSQILSLNSSGKCILLAAAGLDCMPVTIPVQIVLKLVEQNKQCLLIDLDTRRDAIAKVFDLDSNGSPTAVQPHATMIENVHVLPARVLTNDHISKIQSIKELYESKYDIILINAPCLDWHPQRNPIVSVAHHAFIFAQNQSQLKRLRKLCIDKKTKILHCYRPPEAPSSSNAS